MSYPRVAIVGRPNVGKSSLMNMLAGAKVSIVDPTPGTTRDRVSAVVEMHDPDVPGKSRRVELIDTGGFGVYVAEGQRYDDTGKDLAKLTPEIEFQIAKACRTADLILFAVDTQAGITPYDREIARLLREQKLGDDEVKPGKKKSGKKTSERRVPIQVIATKVDGPKWEPHAMELAALGFGDPLMCSSKNNYMRRELLDRLYELVPHVENENTGPASPEMQLAIIGKRNAGKSTLVNTLAGEPRVIVSEIAGTTRDAIDVRFDFDGKVLVAIDTAGLRRKKSFSGRIEWWAFDRAQRAIERCDVALFMIDATEAISQVDEQLGELVKKSFKPAILVVNKWDMVEGKPDKKGRPITTDSYETYIREKLIGLNHAPIAFMSASENLNVRETIALAFDLFEQARTRVGTGKLNRMIQKIVERKGPTDKVGTMAKVYYAAQVAVAPPTIVLVVNKPDLFKPNYRRFLMNRFRETLPYAEVPIKLIVRARKQRESDEEIASELETQAQQKLAGAPIIVDDAADAFFEE